MSIKISELPQATSVGSSDIVPIVQGGTTKQATAGMIQPTIATSISSSSTNDEVAGAKAVYDNALETYSTTETTIGTWINGKPIYRKVFAITMTGSDGVCICRITTNSSIDLIINYNGYITDGTTIYFLNSPRWDNPNADLAFYYIKSSDRIDINTKQDRSGFTGHIWIEYTKTTDTATRSLNLTKSENTGSLVGLGNTAEITDETLEKTKLDEVTDKDVGEKTTEVKEEIKNEKGSGDNE